MIPGAADIMVGRWRMAAWLRVVAAFVLMFAIPSLISWLVEGMRDDDLWDYYYYADRMMLGLLGLSVGAGSFVLAPSIARLLLPVPLATECPRCRYALAGAGGDRCPECGLPVGEAYIASAADPGHGSQRRRSRLLDEIAPAAILLGAVWSLVLGAIIVISMASELGIAGFVIGALLAAPIIISHALALRSRRPMPALPAVGAAPPTEPRAGAEAGRQRL